MKAPQSPKKLEPNLSPSPSSLEISARSPSQLGNALLRFRNQETLTQSHVGTRAGIKQAMVSTIEHGRPGTRLATLFKLLAALDLEIVVRRRRKSVENPPGTIARRA